MGPAAVRRGGIRSCWAGLALVTLIGTAMLVTGCRGGSSGRAVTSLGPTTAAAGSSAGVFSRALAFTQCMRTHGEPNFPAPVREGGSVLQTITPGSGIDPTSPQFTADIKIGAEVAEACRRRSSMIAAPSPFVR